MPAGRSQLNAGKGRIEMKVVMMALTLIAVMSAPAYAGWYNAVAAYGACQEDGLRGVHYALEGDCPNWEAWKANHMKAQTPPQQHAYRASRRKYPVNQ
jgi:hypothetical protein